MRGAASRSAARLVGRRARKTARFKIARQSSVNGSGKVRIANVPNQVAACCCKRR